VSWDLLYVCIFVATVVCSIVVVMLALLLTVVSYLFHSQHSERQAIHSTRKDALIKQKQETAKITNEIGLEISNTYELK
jgi:uncharacterized membrane protein